ncbi:MAG: hypothetical protein HFK10_06155 [Clostridia bacterium]|jgi:hypothetical protein|nr:hypothetical protein [Clostridia bacterium]
MNPYDYFDNDGGLASGLAWMLFAETGEPGYYMMYNDLLKPDDEDTL